VRISHGGSLFCQCSPFFGTAGPENVIGVVLGIFGSLEFGRALLVLASRTRSFDSTICLLHFGTDIVTGDIAAL